MIISQQKFYDDAKFECIKRNMSIAKLETVEKNMCLMHYLAEEGTFDNCQRLNKNIYKHAKAMEMLSFSLALIKTANQISLSGTMESLLPTRTGIKMALKTQRDSIVSLCCEILNFTTNNVVNNFLQ
jgi:glutaminase